METTNRKKELLAMSTAVARVNSLPRDTVAEDLVQMARATRIFVSVPLIPGITPKVLIENGTREERIGANELQRCSGIFQLDDVGLPAFDHGLLYGDAVFEGVLVTGERLFQWREHLQRLYASAERLHIQVPYTPAELTEHVLRVARASKSAGSSYLRLVVTRGIGDLGIHPAKCLGSTVYCIASTIQLYPESLYEQGIHVAIASHTRRSGPAFLDPQIKSCNYLNNILALLETADQSSQETLMLSSDGFVAEATADNVFVVVRPRGWKNEPSLVKMSTPAACYCLKGITRELVLGYGRMLGFQVEESKTMLPSELVGENKEVFLTGTGAGTVPVVSVGGRSVGDGSPGPITRQIRDMLEVDLANPSMGLSVHSTQDELLRQMEGVSGGQAGCQTISEKFIQDMFTTIDSREWEALQRVFDENVTYERPGYEPLVGYARVSKFYREERVIASGTHLLEGIVVNADRAACWGRFVGKHKNGSEIDERFADAYTLRNGRIKTRKSYFFRPAV